jgi:hypothetical protein
VRGIHPTSRDQLRLCCLHAEKPGRTFADSYHDRAVFGASLIRPRIQPLLGDVTRRSFDVVRAETLDGIVGPGRSMLLQRGQ